MSKRKAVPYIIPTRWDGYATKQAPYKLEVNLMKAIKKLSLEETSRYGRTIAPGTLIFNIMLRNREVKHHYNQIILNEENSHEHNTDRIKKEFA